MKKLTKEQVLRMHSVLIAKTGGTDGMRDDGLLDAALATPFQTFDGEDLYPTITEKAVELGFELIRNHAMLDGNKRIGIHTMLVFLALNNISLQYGQDELVRITYGVASGERSKQDLMKWVEVHLQSHYIENSGLKDSGILSANCDLIVTEVKPT